MTKVPVVRCAPGVTFTKIAPGGFRIIAAIDGLSKVLGHDLTITAAADSHSAGRHPTGEAYDLSVQGWALGSIRRALSFLRQTLGDRFTVLYEVPSVPPDSYEAEMAYVNPNATGRHLHLQVKKGSVYPPEGFVTNA